MRVFWFCLNCPDAGEGDRGAELHTRTTKHSTTTTTRADWRPTTNQAAPAAEEGSADG